MHNSWKTYCADCCYHEASLACDRNYQKVRQLIQKAIGHVESINACLALAIKLIFHWYLNQWRRTNEARKNRIIQGGNQVMQNSRKFYPPNQLSEMVSWRQQSGW